MELRATHIQPLGMLGLPLSPCSKSQPPQTSFPLIPPYQVWGLTAGPACECATSPGAGGEGGGPMLRLDPSSTVMLCLTTGAAPWWWGAGGGRAPCAHQ